MWRSVRRIASEIIKKTFMFNFLNSSIITNMTLKNKDNGTRRPKCSFIESVADKQFELIDDLVPGPSVFVGLWILCNENIPTFPRTLD